MRPLGFHWVKHWDDSVEMVWVTVDEKVAILTYLDPPEAQVVPLPYFEAIQIGEVDFSRPN